MELQTIIDVSSVVNLTRLLNWFSEMHNTSILFSMVSGKDNNNPGKLNFCLLFANYYLSYHKVNETNLDWVEFITKANHVTGIVL